MIYDAYAKGPYKVAGTHDPMDKRLVGLIFRPDEWAANTVYYYRNADSYDVVLPTVFTGVYHRVKSPGKSGATEPKWAQIAGDETNDGSVVWEAVNYNLMVPSESITSVTYTPSDRVTVSSASNTSTSCQFMINPLPTTVTSSFQVAMHVVKSNGEEFDVTLQFTVGER